LEKAAFSGESAESPAAFSGEHVKRFEHGLLPVGQDGEARA
jgi:hypothetical protein